MDNFKDDSRESKKAVASDKTQEKLDKEQGDIIEPKCNPALGNCPPEKPVVKEQGDIEPECNPAPGNCPSPPPPAKKPVAKEHRDIELGCNEASGNCP